MKDSFVNNLLKTLHNNKMDAVLRSLIYVMYKVKGKDIKSIRFLEALDVWEFHVGDQYYFSTGPGWAYDFDYLMAAYKANLGWAYVPKAGDVVIDVGAGVGEELLVFARSVGDTGKVLAIEAHPKTFEALRFNSQQNRIANVELINKAISDTPGSIFIDDNANSLGNTISKESKGSVVKVEAVTLDDLIQTHKLNRVDLVKVNIEGAEQLLVKGMSKSVDKIQNMAVSCHDFRYKNEGVEFFKTKDIILKALRDYGFTCVTRDTGNGMIDDYVYASRKQDATA